MHSCKRTDYTSIPFHGTRYVSDRYRRKNKDVRRFSVEIELPRDECVSCLLQVCLYTVRTDILRLDAQPCTSSVSVSWDISIKCLGQNTGANMVHTTPTTLLALTGLAATATAYKHTWRDHMKCAVSIACLHVDLSKEASFSNISPVRLL